MTPSIPARDYIRPGLRSLTPYLVTTGAARLIDFFKAAFNAQEVLRVPLPDGSIMHAEVQIGDSRIELADGGGKYQPMTTAIHLHVSDVDANYRRALDAGATSLYEPVNQEYMCREAGIKDLSGNFWYIATDKQVPGRHVPENLRDVTPYLHVRGAESFVAFLKQAFQAEEGETHWKDGKIMHAKIKIGNSILEFSEAHGEWDPMPGAIHHYVPDADATYQQALAAGATSLDEPNDASYGDRAAGVVDPFGNHWYIATYLGK